MKEIEILIDAFYEWLQGHPVKGYTSREQKMRQSSANQRAYGYLRGFFANLEISFTRRWKKRIPTIGLVYDGTISDTIGNMLKIYKPLLLTTQN